MRNNDSDIAYHAYFEALKEHVIKPLVVKTNDQDENNIRVWVAGCSTGEEAYSIAILFREVMHETGCVRKVKIFATDLDTESITFAARGAYGTEITANCFI